MGPNQTELYNLGKSSGNLCLTDAPEVDVKFTIQAVENIFKDSHFFNTHIEKDFPRFEECEIMTKKLLGNGGFGVVYEIEKVNLQRIDLGEMDPVEKVMQVDNRKFIAEHCIRNKQEEGGGEARYAVKFLRKDVTKDPKMCQQGIMDMVVETYFLSALEHPHIIKMRAFSAAGMYRPDYFVVLDRLYDTLEKRIADWRRRSVKFRGPMKVLKSTKKKARDLKEERLVIAFDLASAIQYLHDKKIVHRDLKPENIGFDIRGDVKIFDFGLARELKEKDRVDHELYKLTGQTGSIRYMAPEIYREEHYNHLADIYSFGIMLWEMHSFCTPYKEYNMKMHKDLVIHKGHRPKIDEKWHLPIKLMMTRSWSDVMKERPAAEYIAKVLKKEIVFLRDGNETGLEHNRRKSTFVMRRNTPKSREVIKANRVGASLGRLLSQKLVQ